MNIATMLRDVLTSLVHRPVTERYPFERQPVPARLRGKIVFDPEKCTGCGLCTRDCPSDALELFVLDRKAKRFVMHYRIDRCLFCSQCVNSCPRSSLSMSNEPWELAALCRKPFDAYYGQDEDVETVLSDGAPVDHEAC
ncbi:MAG: 4Fe-4S dicluster domain-containing protein [Anaerolineae bacterium]|jgi:formate hydrogenlyase subunit 6/NADH:ubiquinone oxidoreductase subunit I